MLKQNGDNILEISHGAGGVDIGAVVHKTRENKSRDTGLNECLRNVKSVLAVKEWFSIKQETYDAYK